MPFDVVVIGAAGVDTCVYLPGAEPLGDVTFTDNRDGVGQAGGYASLGYAALGYPTAYVGAVGDDPAGTLVRSVLGSAGVSTDACFDDPLGTARSVNLMAPDGTRRGCYDGRGNPGLSVDVAVVAGVLAGARLCHVNIPNWARSVLPLARTAGVAVVSDLQDVSDPHDPYRLDFVHGSDLLAFSCARGLDPEAAMRAYWSMNPQLLQIAGLGAAGCAVGVDGSVVHVPVPPSELPVVDTNGAGDSLCVGFAASVVLEGLAPVDAAVRGQRAARIICAQRVPKQRFASPADLA